MDRALYYLFGVASSSSLTPQESVTPCILPMESEGEVQKEKKEECEEKIPPAMVQRGVCLLKEILKNVSVGTGRTVGMSGEDLLMRLEAAWSVATTSSASSSSTVRPESSEKEISSSSSLLTVAPSSSSKAPLTCNNPSLPALHSLSESELSLPLLHRIFEEASIFYCFNRDEEKCSHNSNAEIQEERKKAVGGKISSPLFYFFDWESIMTAVASSLPYEGVTQAQFLHAILRSIHSISSSSSSSFTKAIASPMLPPYTVSFTERERTEEKPSRLVFTSAGGKGGSGTLHRSGNHPSSPLFVVPPSECFGFWVHQRFPHLFSVTRSAKCPSCLLYYSRRGPTVLSPFLPSLPPVLHLTSSIGKRSSMKHQKDHRMEEEEDKCTTAAAAAAAERRHTADTMDGGALWLRDVYAALAVIHRDKLPVWTSFRDAVLPLMQAMHESTGRSFPTEESTEEWYYRFRTSPLFSSHFHLRPSILAKEEGERLSHPPVSQVPSSSPFFSLETLGSDKTGAATSTTTLASSPLSSITAQTKTKSREDVSPTILLPATPSSVWVFLDAISLKGNDKDGGSSAGRLKMLLSTLMNRAMKGTGSSSCDASPSPRAPREMHVIVFTPTVEALTVVRVGAEGRWKAAEEQSEEKRGEEKDTLSLNTRVYSALEEAFGKESAEALISCIKNANEAVEVQLIPVDDLFLDTQHVFGAFLEGPSGRYIAEMWKKSKEQQQGSSTGDGKMERGAWESSGCATTSSILSSSSSNYFLSPRMIVGCGDTVLQAMKKAVVDSSVWQEEEMKKVADRQQEREKKANERHVQDHAGVEPVMFFTYSHCEGIGIFSI